MSKLTPLEIEFVTRWVACIFYLLNNDPDFRLNKQIAAAIGVHEERIAGWKRKTTMPTNANILMAIKNCSFNPLYLFYGISPEIAHKKDFLSTADNLAKLNKYEALVRHLEHF